MTIATYLPQDRLRALARGETLPDRTTGSALFADISGFTPLTEVLRNSLGARRGAEELTRHLGAVYTALIAEIEKLGGSVIDFAGDAIMCWFDEAHGPAAPRAVTCAFALQQAMRSFAAVPLPNGATTSLTVKVTVATGPVRRFVVGDPAIHYLDALAGATVARTATAEHLANKGEVIVDEATAQALGGALPIKEWRTVAESDERFAVVTQLNGATAAPRLPAWPRVLAANQLQMWLPRPVYAREQLGQETFLTEFRPCVVLFVRFLGIDYDTDEAQAQLDACIRQMQWVTSRHDGTLLQLTIGDKGSYAYINFGVLSAHENDARRAVKVAAELREAARQFGFLEPLQIGVTQGTLRAGPYGGQTRKTFGALGDDVNLAARLMQTAMAGEILVSSHVYKAVEGYFSFEPRPPLPMKGKAEPLPVFAVTGERRQRAIRLQEPMYALPMVGRREELAIINEQLTRALQGKSQVIGIVAEAGMGKSRLVAEVIRAARKKGFAGYGGACQSDGVNTPYLAWKSIWSAFFDVDPSAPLKKQMRYLEIEIEDRAPERVPAMPLLNVVLDLEIPDNDFTRALEPQYRKSALHALFEDCLRAATRDQPILLVIEDLHWVDALSHDLLEELAKALADCPICFVLAYRPPHAERTRLQAPHLEALPQFTRIELHELNRAEAEQAIRAKLLQLYPARSGGLPGGLVDKLMTRAQGNPFYLEELLNYLRDRGLDPRDPADLDKIELPDSLHTLVLSRLDQLTESEKTTLRVASIVGRLFRAGWLTGYYPALGELSQVKGDLDKLDKMDITPLDSEPELAYLFKHIVTHEVTYESLPFALRAQLHEQLAFYLEKQIEAGALAESSLLDTLVYHYTRSEDRAKQRAYLRRAGDAAMEVSAFNTAVDYYARLLELTPATDPERSALSLQLARAHYSLGNNAAAQAALGQAQAAAATDGDRADALEFLGEMTAETGGYAEAQTILTEAVRLARTSGDQLTLCRALCIVGANHYTLGRLDDARTACEESLALARSLGNVTRELLALNVLGLVQGRQGDLDENERLMQEIHTRAVAAGNRQIAMVAFVNLGVVASKREDYVATQDYYEQASALAREIGLQQAVALCLMNMASVSIRLGEIAIARAKLHEGLALALRLNVQALVVLAVIDFAELAYAEGQTQRALALMGLARRQSAWSSSDQRALDETLAEWALDPAVVEHELKNGEALDWDKTAEALLKE